jgi:tetratricopeptide (TPR) repeat protein
LQRIAVLPFENLTSNRALDWLGPALASGVVYDLAGLKRLYAARVDSRASTAIADMNRVVQGYFTDEGGALHLRAWIEDPHSGRLLRMLELDAAAATGGLTMVDRIARELSGEARAFSGHDPAAFRAYGQALMTNDARARAELLKSAAEREPNFAAAALAWAETLLALGDRAGSTAALAKAKLDPLDAATAKFVSARAAGAADGQVRALEDLFKLTPADPEVARGLGQALFAERKFGDAARILTEATRLDPNDPGAWNLLGYAKAYAHDLEGARQSLLEYQKLVPPGDVNALDSLGEVSFYLGDFAGAEHYFNAAQQKNAAGGDGVKAAQARLMTGDRDGADMLFRAALGAGGPLQLAQWEFLTGRRKQALARVEALLPELAGEPLATAKSQAALWRLETGDRTAASRLAREAAAATANPNTRSIAALVFTVAQEIRADGGSPLANAYAQMLSRRFSEAVPALEIAYRETNPSLDAPVRTLLAWAYVESGRARDARALTDLYPIPLSSGDPVLASLLFPRFLYLRGAALQADGKPAEARRSFDLFLKYAGDLPDIFGEAAKARQAL